MFINQKQAEALHILADEIDRPVTDRKYGYLLFEDGKDCGHTEVDLDLLPRSLCEYLYLLFRMK